MEHKLVNISEAKFEAKVKELENILKRVESRLTSVKSKVETASNFARSNGIYWSKTPRHYFCPKKAEDSIYFAREILYLAKEY
jgi:hypothetical protein